VVYVRTPRLGTTARKIKRLEGSAAESSMEKAKRITAEKNLDSGTPKYSTLSSCTNASLSAVLEDCCVIINPARGSLGKILDLLRAKGLRRLSWPKQLSCVLGRLHSVPPGRWRPALHPSQTREVSTG
jgi:hypothetical protein